MIEEKDIIEPKKVYKIDSFEDKILVFYGASWICISLLKTPKEPDEMIPFEKFRSHDQSNQAQTPSAQLNPFDPSRFDSLSIIPDINGLKTSLIATLGDEENLFFVDYSEKNKIMIFKFSTKNPVFLILRREGVRLKRGDLSLCQPEPQVRAQYRLYRDLEVQI